MSDITELEQEFINEQKGEGSLSVFISDGDANLYVGYDINPEDIEALYFEGIGVPRWESLKADSVEQQTAMYWERFNASMAKYPLIGRVRDTDERVEFTDAEVPQLLAECESVAAGTSDAKAVRASQKISIAAGKAADASGGLSLVPSQLPVR